MDELNKEVVQPEQPGKEAGQEVNLEELKAQLEQIKRTQAGSDKAYAEAAKKAAELAAENEKLKKEKMSEKERAEFEHAKQKAELEAKEREVREATLHLSKMRLMGAKQMPLEFADFISGADEAELEAKLDTLSKLVEAEVGKRVQERLLSGEKPKSGTVADSKPGNEFLGKSFAEIERAIREGKYK